MSDMNDLQGAIQLALGIMFALGFIAGVVSSAIFGWSRKGR